MHARDTVMNGGFVSLMTAVVLVCVPSASAADSKVEVAACLFSPSDMLRQPKNLPPVLADSIFNCGKQGEHSLARLYENGWRLIQVLPNGAYNNPWIGIFERHKQ